MAQHAMGEVKPASTVTALRATNNEVTPSKQFPAQALQFQALATNTGSIYICDRETPSLTANVHVEIPPPSNSTPITRPAWSVGNPAGANPLNGADYWILPAVSGEGVRITAVRT
jgi:hypothetical protein